MIKSIHLYQIVENKSNDQEKEAQKYGIRTLLQSRKLLTAKNSRTRLKKSSHKVDISKRKRVQYPKINYDKMQELSKDKALEDLYNGGAFEPEQKWKYAQNFYESEAEDEIKEFEGIGDRDRYLVLDLDETMIFTEFLTRESAEPNCLYLELKEGTKYKVCFP